MLKIDLIVVGRLRKGPYFELVQEFARRIRWSLSVYEVESKQTDPVSSQAEESRKILEHIKDGAFVVALDERGKNLRSLDFAKALESWQTIGHSQVQFVIGGADGLTPDIKNRANFMLSLGLQTWPHMMARAMVLEQIYRAQQILAGHPYHRE